VGLQVELLDLHRGLRPPQAPSTPTTPGSPSAEFTEEDRELLRKLKLQLRAFDPTTTNTVDRGNQMQLTASAFSQQGPQGAQDKEQLMRMIAELQVRQARTDGSLTDIAVEVKKRLEDVDDRVDQLGGAPAVPGTDGAQGCCTVS
jgi:hypothetical protein